MAEESLPDELETMSDEEVLASVQGELLEGVKALRKALAGESMPMLVGVGILAILLAGSLIGTGSLVLGGIALVLVLGAAILLLGGRHVLYARSCSSVERYLEDGTPLKAPSRVKIPLRRTPIPTPQNVYDATWAGMDEGDQYLRESLEEHLAA